ncbi:MAG: MotA/TolQ/ExbB proton channel family protein [Candidatus Omnitrophica bacterium]|nr:MotA/TolQ/ExbB proton channel family protein [Candidatus Omnitrophota bacterium]
MLYDLFQKGGPVMWPLLACSVIAMTVVTERLLFWTAVRRNRSREGVQRMLESVRRGNVENARQIGRSVQDPVARVLEAGLQHWPGGVLNAVEVQVQEELRWMRRYLSVLETTITLSPLLGIYGTITGIIRAFGFLGQGGVPDPQLVAAGIAEALITTAAGLTIAILAIPPYNFFVSKTEEMAHEVERQATALELMVGRSA